MKLLLPGIALATILATGALAQGLIPSGDPVRVRASEQAPWERRPAAEVRGSRVVRQQEGAWVEVELANGQRLQVNWNSVAQHRNDIVQAPVSPGTNRGGQQGLGPR